MAYRRGLGAFSIPDLITNSANRYGVPPSLALAVARRESGFNQSALSPKGAIGVMQLMAPTAADLRVNPYDLEQNIDGGVRYLRDMYKMFGDWDLALQAYNGGPGNVQRHTVSADARSYSAAVLAAAGLQNQTPGAFWYSEAGESGTGLSGAAIAAIALMGFAGLYLLAD